MDMPVTKAEYWFWRKFFALLDRLTPEQYVLNVRKAEKNGRTYLPDIYGNYPPNPPGTRPMVERDIAGRWSLGWRPPKKRKAVKFPVVDTSEKKSMKERVKDIGKLVVNTFKRMWGWEWKPKTKKGDSINDK